MSEDQSPDARMEEAWDNSDGYEVAGRKLTWSRAHVVMAERIGLNIRRALTAQADAEAVSVTYDGVFEDIAVILYVASLDAAGLRRARRNPDAAKDAACEIFDDWDIPLSGPRFEEAQGVAMRMLADVADSQTKTETNGEEAPDDGGKKH
ncbi:MAG: hypothetical protein IPK72_22035 [Candidatus Eisenbacteria bacterium]|nr:hypothetical protein [Candidatus Eisenbacteria bacterium]